MRERYTYLIVYLLLILCDINVHLLLSSYFQEYERASRDEQEEIDLGNDYHPEDSDEEEESDEDVAEEDEGDMSDVDEHDVPADLAADLAERNFGLKDEDSNIREVELPLLGALPTVSTTLQNSEGNTIFHYKI